jgi:hypothetical protein
MLSRCSKLTMHVGLTAAAFQMRSSMCVRCTSLVFAWRPLTQCVAAIIRYPAQVRRVPVSSLPKCYRVEYIELYELKP